MPLEDLRGDENYEQQSISPKSNTFKELKSEKKQKIREGASLTAKWQRRVVSTVGSFTLCG